MRKDPRSLLVEPADRRPGPLRRTRRAIFRTRYILAPFWVALTVAAISAQLRATFPAWCAMIVVAALLAAADIAAGRRAGSEGEQRLIVLAALTAALWAGWTIFAGVGAQQCATLTIIALVGGVPWWRSHRVRVRRPINRLVRRWPHAVAASGLRGVTITGTEVAAPGQWTHRLDLGGHTYADLAGALGKLEARLGLRRGCLRAEPVLQHADRALLHVVEKDPLAPPPTATADEGISYPGPAARTVADPIEIGPYEDDTPIQLRLPGGHILIVGATGAGKGVLIDVLLAEVEGMVDAEAWMIDFKQGRTGKKWGSTLRHLATNAGGGEASLRDARLLLRHAVATVAARASAGAETGLDQHVATPDNPHIVLIIDEAERVLDDPECLQMIEDLSNTARSEAVTLILVVKRATVGSLGSGQLPTNLRTRIILGELNNPRDLQYAMPGVDDLPLESLDRPGKIFVKQGGVKARPGRVYRITGEQVREIRAQVEAAEPAAPTAIASSVTPATDAEDGPRAASLAGHAGASETPLPDFTRRPDETPADAYERVLMEAGPRGVAYSEFRTVTGWAHSTVYDRLSRDRNATPPRVVQAAGKRWALAKFASTDGALEQQSPTTGAVCAER